jgi:NADPH:quinone reductase-like Zn-dependent oxidoreductase
MKAAIHLKYGPPEVVTIKEVNIPTPSNNELLIKVFASTVNRTDCGFRSAEYFISRFWSGLFKPKYITLGCEFSGEVIEIGSSVTRFKKGDLIFGFNDKTFGGHAEFVIRNENDAIDTLPNNCSLVHSAAILEGSHYALSNIRAAKITRNQYVLINGGTGAIGSAAIQLVKQLGASVTVVTDTKNVELVRSLGADVVIDYLKEDFTQINSKYDVILDAVGKSTFGKCKPLLTKKGIYISTELGPYGQNPFLALITPLFGRKKVLFPIPTINNEIVSYIKNSVETGSFKPLIDRTYSLNQIVEAYKYVETGQKIGNIIIQMRNSENE